MAVPAITSANLFVWVVIYKLSHTEMTRLSQPCDKVVTTMSTIDKVVTTLWIGCHSRANMNK